MKAVVRPVRSAVALRIGLPVVAMAFLLGFPFVSGSYYLTLLTLILIAAIYAMGLDLMFGYAGLHSLGHAAFIGVGAYSIGLMAKGVSANFYLGLVVALLASAITAACIGLLALRSRGSYFLMITLALGQVVWALAHGWRDLTGGDDGMQGIKRPDLGLPVSLNDPLTYYFFVLAFFLLSAVILYRIVNSPFGLGLVGLREREGRMSALGYNTSFIKLAAFVLAGVFAGLGGVLLAFYKGSASPQYLNFDASIEVFLMVIVGGAGTLVGPILGAAVLIVTKNIVASYTEHWTTVMGIVYVIVALSNSNGIVVWLKGLVR